MSDAAVAPPPAAAGGSAPVGKVRNPWAVIGLSIITLGIYFLYWTYSVFTEMKNRTGEGVGGPIGLIIGIFIGIVNCFLIPAEAGTMYAREGRQKPVSGVTGFWNLIPLVGWIIWVIKVQGALNDEWVRGGASAV
jgi:hypothetical protein